MADKFINLNNGITTIKTWVLNKLSDKMNNVEDPIPNDILVTDANGQAVGSGSSIEDLEERYMIDYEYTSCSEVADAFERRKILEIKSEATEDSVASYANYDENTISYNLHAYEGLDTNGQLLFAKYSVNSEDEWSKTTKSVYTATQVDEKIPEEATETTAGTIKLNPNQSITLNASGQLEVGGRIGQFEGTTGLFAPNNRDPRNVNNYSFLITDAMGMDMTANRSMAVVSGLGLACRSAAAGSTEYRISNTYANRIQAILCAGGYAAKDEATSTQQRIIPIVSVTINGSSFIPDSSANPSGTTSDIIIKTAETLNPDSAITNIRLFGKMGSYATLHAGNGIASESGGRNLLLGGGVTKAGSANDNCLVGNGIYSNGNGNACFGRYHIARKNRGLLAGTGHDTTNAPSEGASAVGQYSFMDASTLFAVGNGSTHTDRKNAFEVRSDGIVLRSPNGTRYIVTVDNNGNLSTTAL